MSCIPEINNPSYDKLFESIMSWKPRQKRVLRKKWSVVLNTAKVCSEIKPEAIIVVATL